jgi:hypothetical protein
MGQKKGARRIFVRHHSERKMNVMRCRISALMLGAILLFSLAACSKKEQSQNPPSGTDTSGQAQTAQPGGGQMAPAGGQMAPAQGQQMAQAPAQQMTPEPPPPPPPIVVPAGTNVVVRMGTALGSKTAHDGQTFTGTLARAIAAHGKVVIPAGSGVTGTVSDAKSAGKFKGEAIIAIRLTSINVNGVPHDVSTDEYCVTQKGKGKRTAVVIAGGTGAGALIGGIAGGGKGALIGGLIGAGAGTAGAAFTGNKELTIPAESAVTFKMTSSLTLPAQAPNQ